MDIADASRQGGVKESAAFVHREFTRDEARRIASNIAKLAGAVENLLN